MLKERKVLLLRLPILILPLALSPAVGFLLAEGIINLGGGEKDILFLIPWFLWSVLFFICGLVLWRSITKTKTWLARSTFWSVGIMVGLWLLLLAYSLYTARAI